MPVEQADLVIAATPVFRGSYTGLFKHFFDLAPISTHSRTRPFSSPPPAEVSTTPWSWSMRYGRCSASSKR